MNVATVDVDSDMTANLTAQQVEQNHITIPGYLGAVKSTLSRFVKYPAWSKSSIIFSKSLPSVNFLLIMGYVRIYFVKY